MVTLGTDAQGAILDIMELCTAVRWACTCKGLHISLWMLLSLQHHQHLNLAMMTMKRMRAVTVALMQLPRLRHFRLGNWILSVDSIGKSIAALDASSGALDVGELMDSDGFWTPAQPGMEYEGTSVADMLGSCIIAAHLEHAEPSLRCQVRVGTTDGTDGPLVCYSGSLAQISRQCRSGEIWLSDAEIILLHSLYLTVEPAVVETDWAELASSVSGNALKWNPYRYYKDEDQIHLSFSMVRLGDVGAIVIAAKLRISLPALLHPAHHCSHLQRLNISQCQLGTAGFIAIVDALHVTRSLPRLQRLEAEENRIGDAAIELLCQTLRTVLPHQSEASDDPYAMGAGGDDEYHLRPFSMDRLHNLNLNSNLLTETALLALSNALDAGALDGFGQGETPYLGLMGGSFSDQLRLDFDRRWEEKGFSRNVRPFFGHQYR